MTAPPLAAVLPSRHRGLTSLRLAGYELDAVSIGGQETCICVPALRVAFDIGRCPQRACTFETLLLSHCHLDHVGGAGAYVATRSLLGLSPPVVCVPAACAAPLERHFQALRELDGSQLACTVQPCCVGESLELNGGRHTVRPFATQHTVDSQGYCIFSRRSKLKPQFAGLPGAHIAQLRAQGTEVTDAVEVAEVAFTGDTCASWVHSPSAADALRAKLLIMECTFVDGAVSAADAARFGHSHLDEIVEHAHLFQNEAILLIHFSARYKRSDIEAALAAKLPPSLRARVTPLLEGFS